MASLADTARDEREARAMLTMIVSAGDETVGRLLGREGGIETLRLLESNHAIPGVSVEESAILQGTMHMVSSRLSFDDDLREALDGSYAVLIPGDKDWPVSLDDLGDRAPYALWARGATSFLAEPTYARLTVAGSRAATDYGVNVTAELVSEAARREQVIVTGGAYGVDAAALRAALGVQGHTVAVMAGGLDRFYPAGNTELLGRVADYGLVVSEQPPGAVPTRQRFIDRSRILAGLSGSTVIVEAAARSGSALIAREAARLGRGVGAVPGPVTSAASTGTHQLLREGTARLVANSDDLVELAAQPRPAQGRRSSRSMSVAREEPCIEPETPGRSL